MQMNNFENIINESNSLDKLSRDIITYFSTNSQFDEKLSDDNSLECQLFNLALQYLDKNRASERKDIGHKLEELIINYKNLLS